MPYKINEILKELKIENYEIKGNLQMEFSKPSTIWESEKGSITFCSKKSVQHPIEVINESQASVILVDKDIDLKDLVLKHKAVVLLENPQDILIKILRKCFPLEVKRGGTHPSAIVDEKADIHPSVYIGPNCIIGKCKIEANSIIHANVIINDCVTIGKNVIIYPSCLIGYDGFGHIKTEDNVLVNFPQYGGVIIEDNVEIFPLTNVDRGTLGTTIIGSGTKVDHYCHIGHNVIIGKNCVITACTVIAGSTKVGDCVWIGINSAIREYTVIGDKAFIGMGSVVTKDVPDNTVVAGNPARPFPDKNLHGKEGNKNRTE